MNNFKKRKESYLNQYFDLIKRCKACPTQIPDRCMSCTIGKKLHYLESTYSDITGWNNKN